MPWNLPLPVAWLPLMRLRSHSVRLLPLAWLESPPPAAAELFVAAGRTPPKSRALLHRDRHTRRGTCAALTSRQWALQLVLLCPRVSGCTCILFNQIIGHKATMSNSGQRRLAEYVSYGRHGNSHV